MIGPIAIERPSSNAARGLARRFSRYAEYFVRWLILEKPRGLDFSMRAKSIAVSGYHGYALTSRKAVRNILRGLPIDSKDSFLDVGCGKGGVLAYASEFEFGRLDGIEVNAHLVEIAERNIARLQLADRVRIMRADATTFDNYKNYNFFFLFNPFDAQIYEKVMSRILESVDRNDGFTRPIWLLCYGASSDICIKASNRFDLYRDETCPHRANTVRIWKLKCCP